MHKDVEKLLEQSLPPLPWTIAMMGLTTTAILLHSAIVGMLAGATIGAYFGDYHGRFAVMKAWRKQIDIDHQEHMSKLKVEYEPANRDFIH